MAELTAGYVAGVIALGIVVAQLWCPNAITFILAGQLRDRETASTWTVASRFLQSSLWPTLLQSDSSQNHGVRKSVVLTTIAVPLIGLLVSIAGVVTPLGLYERDELGDEEISTAFSYVRDSSAFFMGTSPRDNDKPFSRTCTLTVGGLNSACAIPCPYSSDVAVVEVKGTSYTCPSPRGFNLTVPNILREIYTSGTSAQRTTLSNYFDIEWRQLTTSYNQYAGNGTRVPAGAFRLLESLSLDNTIRPVEGLVVDGKSGGIGFRNHTLPTDPSRRGISWSEDLLFIEPEVECANNNLTIDFQITTGLRGQFSSVSISKLWLTDHGGFVNLDSNSPIIPPDQRTRVNKPDLKARAYRGAWVANAESMLLMDIMDPTDNKTGTKAFQRVDSELDKTFSLPVEDGIFSSYQSLDFLQDFASHFGLTALGFKGKLLYPNPHNITAEDFGFARRICQETYSTDKTKLNNTYVACNLVRGVPRRLDEGQSMVFEDNSTWSAPMYTCASAVKATIKTVTFFHNGTSDDLSNLVVQEIKDKEYSREEDMPLWGYEDWEYTFQQYQPIWGLVHPAYEGFEHVQTLRAPSLYMIGSLEDALVKLNLDPKYPSTNLPGSIVPIAAMTTIATNSKSTSGSTTFDFSGKDSMSLWLKWGQLSQSAEQISSIIELLWTDLAASAVVGTKGILGSRNAHPDEAAKVGVRQTVHKVKYRWAFGIPAFIVALIMCLIFLAVIVSAVLGQSSLAAMSHRLKQVSLGRAITTVLSPQTSSFLQSPKEWGDMNAEKVLDLGTGSLPSGREVEQQVQQVPAGSNGHYSAVPPQPAYSPQPYQGEGVQYFSQDKGQWSHGISSSNV